METRLTNSHREEQLGQHVEHSKPKTMGSFIWGQQTTLLENFFVTCMCLERLHLKSNYNPFTGWFVQQTSAAVVTLPNFNYWHMTNQANCPWLTHACVSTLKPVLVLLGNISSNFDNQEFLKESYSLPYEKNVRLARLTHDTFEQL